MFLYKITTPWISNCLYRGQYYDIDIDELYYHHHHNLLLQINHLQRSPLSNIIDNEYHWQFGD